MALLIGGRGGYLVFEEDNGTYRVDKGTLEARVTYKEELEFEEAVEYLRKPKKR